jgi:lipopolysaccharide transport system permease protein
MFLLRILDPAANLSALTGAVGLVVRHRGLVAAMTSRELTDRYAGQVLGAAWAIISPLLTMLIYVGIFTFIFRGRLGEIENTAAFTAYALAGLAPWVSFSEGVSRAVGAITGNGNLVKQIVFPVEVLPLKIVLATFPTLAIGIVLAAGAAYMSGLLDVLRFLLLIAPAILSYFFFLAGISYFLAAAGVFFRDLKDIIAFILGVGLFLNPILYPPGAAPPWLAATFPYNPMANMVYWFHHAVVGPVDPPNYALFVLPIVSIVVFVLGWRTFQLLKPSFGNAL